MRTCQDCYYCNESFQFAEEWWCECSNPARSVEAPFKKQFLGNPILKSSSNLPCWRADAPSAFSQLTTIRPHKPMKDTSRLSRYYHKKNLTIPWSYVLRSRITSLNRKEEGSR